MFGFRRVFRALRIIGSLVKYLEDVILVLNKFSDDPDARRLMIEGKLILGRIKRI